MAKEISFQEARKITLKQQKEFESRWKKYIKEEARQNDICNDCEWKERWRELKRRLENFEIRNCIYPEAVIKEMEELEQQ